MPSPKYDNAYLASRPKLHVEIQPGEREVGQTPVEPSIDEILGKAHETLSNSGRFLESLQPAASSDVSQPDDSVGPSVFNTPLEKLRMLAGRIARPIPAAAEKAAGVGMFLAPEVAIPSQMILGAGSARNLYNRGTAGVTEHPFQTAMDVGGVALGAAGAAGLMGRVNALREAGAMKMRPAADFGALSPEAQARNIDATNMVEEGFSRPVAGKLAGIPGAGQSKATIIRHLSQIPDEPVERALANLHMPKTPKTADDILERMSQSNERGLAQPSHFTEMAPSEPGLPGETVRTFAGGPTRNNAIGYDDMLARLDKAIVEMRGEEAAKIRGTAADIPDNPQARALELKRLLATLK